MFLLEFQEKRIPAPVYARGNFYKNNWFPNVFFPKIYSCAVCICRMIVSWPNRFQLFHKSGIFQKIIWFWTDQITEMSYDRNFGACSHTKIFWSKSILHSGAWLQNAMVVVWAWAGRSWPSAIPFPWAIFRTLRVSDTFDVSTKCNVFALGTHAF